MFRQDGGHPSDRCSRQSYVMWTLVDAYKYTAGKRLSGGKRLCSFCSVSLHICKGRDVSTDFLVDRHTWSPHGKGRGGVPSYRWLARRQVGSKFRRKQECLVQCVHTRCTTKQRKRIHKNALEDRASLKHIHPVQPWSHPETRVRPPDQQSWRRLASRSTPSLTAQSGVFWALCISFRASLPHTLPTMPSCLLRLHQNCPSATTSLRASRRACQQRQPVTADLNQEIICWEASIWEDSLRNAVYITSTVIEMAFCWPPSVPKQSLESRLLCICSTFMELCNKSLFRTMNIYTKKPQTSGLHMRTEPQWCLFRVLLPPDLTETSFYFSLIIVIGVSINSWWTSAGQYGKKIEYHDVFYHNIPQ